MSLCKLRSARHVSRVEERCTEKKLTVAFKRRSGPRRCFARNSRDSRDAEGSLVGREHERVRRRMTGRRPTTGQRLVDVVTGDQRTADINVRVTRPYCSLEREAGAVALASRAQAMSRNVGPPQRRMGNEQIARFVNASVTAD